MKTNHDHLGSSTKGALKPGEAVCAGPAVILLVLSEAEQSRPYLPPVPYRLVL